MKKYEAFTLLEIIIVMVVFFTLSTVGVVTYRGLVDSFAINEVSLKIMQDIRSVQRTAMMVDREPGERWLYGIGVDFTKLETDKKYTVFKWCSEFDEYSSDPSKISRELPNLSAYTPEGLELAVLHVNNLLVSCKRTDDKDDGVLVLRTENLESYENIQFRLLGEARYVIFDSVSGKTFLYNELGRLLNYEISGGDVLIKEASLLELFDIRISPIRGDNLTTRSVKVRPVSGLVYFQINMSDDEEIFLNPSPGSFEEGVDDVPSLPFDPPPPASFVDDDSPLPPPPASPARPAPPPPVMPYR